MTERRSRIAGIRGLGGLCLLASAAALLSCTFYQPPSPYLPTRESLAPGQTVTVGPSQNVYAVAQQYHVSMRDVIVLNDLQPPFAIKPGQQLVLPAAPGAAPQEPMGAPEELENGSSYLPPGGPPSSASVEQQELPPVEAAPQAPSTVVTQYQNAPQPAGSGNPPSLQQLATPAPMSGNVATTASPPQQMASITPLPAPAAPSETTPQPSFAMIWPVQGPILSGFGPKGQGLRNDGINIGAPKGSPVVAAANGIVVYAGDEMKGFGNLILIRHQNGWVTAYAHLARMLVSKDSVVVQGDEIGTVGKTGNVGSPQLHFEVRYGDKPVDPSALIKR